MKRFATATAIAAALAGPALADGLTRFDVAEDLSRFVWDEAPTFEDGMPAYGSAFVTQGYIYPAGTLDGGVEGTNPDGSAAFPEKVIGTWTCDGYFVGEGMQTATGDIVITRQIYQFADGDVLVSHGSELADIDVPVTRAVTGGTGDYAEAGPEITQVLLGMSDGYGVRLQMTLGSPREARVFDEELRPAERADTLRRRGETLGVRGDTSGDDEPRLSGDAREGLPGRESLSRYDHDPADDFAFPATKPGA